MSYTEFYDSYRDRLENLVYLLEGFPPNDERTVKILRTISSILKELVADVGRLEHK